MTNLKQEILDNGDDDLDFNILTDVEHALNEMIVVRSDSSQEIEERVAAFVEMLKPANAFAVFAEARRWKKARRKDVESGDTSCLETYDALLNGLRPWLAQQGYTLT